MGDPIDDSGGGGPGEVGNIVLVLYSMILMVQSPTT